MIAGLPDGETPVALAVCTRSHSTFVVRRHGQTWAGTARRFPAAVLRIVGYCALKAGISPPGEARHIAFLSAVIYG
jgi:hypothetical protein